VSPAWPPDSGPSPRPQDRSGLARGRGEEERAADRRTAVRFRRIGFFRAAGFRRAGAAARFFAFRVGAALRRDAFFLTAAFFRPAPGFRAPTFRRAIVRAPPKGEGYETADSLARVRGPHPS
jgi:hypothetical protein